MSNYDTDRDGSLNFHEFSVLVGQNRNMFPINWGAGEFYPSIGYSRHDRPRHPFATFY
jgi:hypothetical protein